MALHFPADIFRMARTSNAGLSARRAMAMIAALGCVLAAPRWLRAAAPPAAGGPLSAPPLSLDYCAQSNSAVATLADLSGFSLEALMSIEVTSVSKQKQRLSDAAAAISVISHEDIARTHYQNIPDLLSLAPGVAVNQLNSSAWSIGTRGGAFRYTPNLLVMMDGRSIYTPSFSGVTWNTVDYVMADLERIEVIRGPGATLWGANAVNGVINITTKDAKDTQGFLLDSYAGSDGFINSFRYGGKAGGNTFFRVYGKAKNMNDFQVPGGGSNQDDWDQFRTGFRIDTDLTPADKFTFQGDYFASRDGSVVLTPTPAPPYNQVTHGPFNVSGDDLEARWTHTFSETSDLTVQFYYDNLQNTGRENYGFDNTLNTLDLDFQHRFAVGNSQEIIWGGDYRFSLNEIANNPATGFSSAKSNIDLQIVSAFIQDDITLIPKRLHLIAGSKLEYDSITNATEPQPSIRGIWTPDEKNTLWAAVSRAARTPGISEKFLSATLSQIPLPNGSAMNMVLAGDSSIPSEHLMAYEAGYRVEPVKSLSIDLATFYNTSDNSRGLVTGAPTFRNGQMVLPASFVADRSTQSCGFELATTWNATDKLRIAGSYSYLNIIKYGGMPSLMLPEDPAHQFKVQMHYDLTKEIDFSSEFYWASKNNISDIPALLRWDIGAAWRPEKHTELRAGVRNLLDNNHREYSGTASILGGSEVPRTFYVELQVQF